MTVLMPRNTKTAEVIRISWSKNYYSVKKSNWINEIDIAGTAAYLYCVDHRDLTILVLCLAVDQSSIHRHP